MKKIFYLLLLAIIAYGAYTFMSPKVDFTKDAKEGIQFSKSSWSEVLATAKKENKIIFLDIYAIWCGNCKKLKKNTFSDKNAGTYFNRRFINVSLDGEKGDGEMLVKKYAVESYPILMFLDGDGKIIKQAGGYQNTEELINLGKSVSE